MPFACRLECALAGSDRADRRRDREAGKATLQRTLHQPARLRRPRRARRVGCRDLARAIRPRLLYDNRSNQSQGPEGPAGRRPNPTGGMDRSCDPGLGRQHAMLGSTQSNRKSAPAEPAVHRVAAVLCRVVGTADKRRLAVFVGVPSSRADDLRIRETGDNDMEELIRPVISPAHGTRSLIRRHKAWSRCWLASASTPFSHKQRCLCQQIAGSPATCRSGHSLCDREGCGG